MTGAGKSCLLGLAAAVPLMQPGIPDALLDRADVPPETQESTSSLVANLGEAVQEGVEGARRGEDAAGAEQVPEPDYSDTSPPPPGSSWEVGTPEPQAEAGAEPEVVAEAGTPEPQAEAGAEPEPLFAEREPDPEAEPEPELS